MPEYTVRQGETTARIAYERGFFWETIWNHPNNAALRERREHANILYPEDVVFIPDKEEKQESGSTEQRHLFQRKGVPEKMRIRLLDENDEPRSDVPYLLEIDGNSFTGTTNTAGMIEHPIPPDARRGRLIVGESQDEEHQLNLGYLDPLHEISGIQARINNLGVYHVYLDVNGEMGPETVAALKEFQRKYDLPETGEVDEATRGRLEEVHGS